MKQINIPNLLLKLGILFVVLTGVDAAIFVFVSFQNQTDLLIENSSQKAKIVAMELYSSIDNYEDRMEAAEEEQITIEHLVSILPEILTELNIKTYRIFDGYTNVLLDSDEEPEQASNTEKEIILTAITAYSFQTRSFQTDSLQEFKSINLYVPIGLENRFLVIKAQINLENIQEQYMAIIRNAAIIGGIVFLLHLLIMLISYLVLIKPLRKANQELRAFNQSIEEELKMARQIQESILPKEPPLQDKITLHIAYLTMEAIGGDLIDAISIDENRVAFLVVDVMGHGIPSAMLTTMIKIAFSQNILKNPDNQTGEILKRVNHQLVNIMSDSGYYCTAFLIIYDHLRKILYFTSAGHPQAYLFNSDHEEITPLSTSDFNLGMMDDMEFSTQTCSINSHNRLFIYSDGIIESVNEKEEAFGSHRLEQFIQSHRSLSPQNFTEDLLEKLHHFQKSSKQNDDISFIVIEFK